MMNANAMVWRTRWAALGAAVAVALGGGGLAITQAASSPESATVMIDPVRVLDTRDPLNVGLPGPFVSPVSQKLQVTGSVATTTGDRSVVPTGATGVLLNVAVVGPTAGGFLSIRPGDASGEAATSSINFTVGQSIANSVQVALPLTGAQAGKIDITYNALGAVGPTTEVLIDVVGYTTDAKLTALQAQVDALIAETPRSVFADGEQSLALSGVGQIARTVSLVPPSNGNVIVTASAFVLNSGGSAASARCTITTGTVNEPGYFHLTSPPSDGNDNWATIGGTRGFSVTSGVPFTANYVCDQQGVDVLLRNSSLAATFTPT